MAIVYQHLRKDTGEVFYIGIGKAEKRAYNFNNRTDFWKRIVDKHGYLIEILYDNITWEEACEIEKSLISKHGKLCNGTGSLCNFTDGGDGIVGLIRTEEHKRKLSETNKAKFLSGETAEHLRTLWKCSSGRKGVKATKEFGENVSKRLKLVYQDKHNHPSITPVLQYDLQGNFIKEYFCIEEAREVTNAVSIGKVCRGKRKTSGGFIWRYKDDIQNQHVGKYISPHNREILQYDLQGVFIREYNSIKEAQDNTNINNISAVCRGERKKAGGFIWKYKHQQ